MFLPEIKETEVITRSDFLTTHSIHWEIECYHRAIKQLCGIKKFMVRSSALHSCGMLLIARSQGTNIFQLVIGTVLCFK